MIEKLKTNWEAFVKTMQKCPMSFLTVENYQFITEKPTDDTFYTQERDERAAKLMVDTVMKAGETLLKSINSMNKEAKETKGS